MTQVDLELRSDRLRLRTMIAADRDALVAIRSTPEVRRRWRADDLEAEFDDALTDLETTRLTILACADDAVLGLIQFAEELDPDYRHASLDIYLDPATHGRGLGSEAIRTLVDHLFESAGHHRITIDPAADNEPAIRCYAAVGFEPVGVMRAYERQADGTWGDGLLMELLAPGR